MYLLDGYSGGIFYLFLVRYISYMARSTWKYWECRAGSWKLHRSGAGMESPRFLAVQAPHLAAPASATVGRTGTINLALSGLDPATRRLRSVAYSRIQYPGVKRHPGWASARRCSSNRWAFARSLFYVGYRKGCVLGSNNTINSSS